MEDHAAADSHNAASGGAHSAAGIYALYEDAAHAEFMQEEVSG